MRYLSDDEFRKLTSYIREKAENAKRRGSTRAVIDELIILLLLNTGLQPSELCDLNIDDLITEHGRKTIRIRDVSGNVLREVDITGAMVEHVRRFVRIYRRKAKPGDPLVVSERGTRFSYMSLYNKIKKVGRQAHIGNLHPRVLRSTYLIRLYNSERDLRFVQQQAGHSSPRTTAMYAIAAGERNLPVVSLEKAASVTAEHTYYSNGRVMEEMYIGEGAAKHKETVSLDGFKQIKKCEGCAKAISAENGTRIDSGQILCSDCLKELRSI